MKNKKRYTGLLVALALSMAVVGIAGAAVKYRILAPLGLGMEEDSPAIPFLLLSDGDLSNQLALAQEMEEEPGGPDNAPDPEESLPATKEQDDTFEESTGESDTKEGESSTTQELSTDDQAEPATTQKEPEEPTTKAEETKEPNTKEKNTKEPNTKEKETKEPATKEEETKEPTTKEKETKEPTTKEKETKEPTTKEKETKKPGKPDSSSGAPQSPGGVWEPTGDPVDDSWFDDALFIGDSRTMGLRDYARLGDADYFCFVSANVFNITKKSASDTNFKEQKLEKLLGSKTYGKIFIILGYNEAGYPHKQILKGYRELIALIQDAQPDAVIIIQSIMTAGHKEADVYDYAEPTNLYAINRKLADLADNSEIFYIDVNPVFADENGYLPTKYSSDGAHLKAKACPIWADWLKEAVAGIA